MAQHLPVGSTPLTPPITVLASTRAVLQGRLTEATIVVSNLSGKVISVFYSVLPAEQFPPGIRYVDHSPDILIPGLVDAHVHLNEPGRTEWEGFWTGTRAAAFGGVTTVVDMPLNAIPPTTTVANLQEKIKAAQGQCWVDVGFYGGIIPGNEKELKPLVRAGVRGFKGFLIDSGVDEFPAVSLRDIRTALEELADEPTVVMFHAEMIPSEEILQHTHPPTGPLNAYQTFLDSRPPSFETCAIQEILPLAPLAPNLPLHIVHLSAIEAIPMLRKARADGVQITAETCFHYLSFAAEEIRHGDTRHKCCPPIRAQANQNGLWMELVRTDDPVIKTIVSDHSPCTPELKLLPSKSNSPSAPQIVAAIEGGEGDFLRAWGGISSVGLGLSILWTEASRRGASVTIEDIVRWCWTNTAQQVGLEHEKGDIRMGMDADITVFDPDASFTVEPGAMLFRNKCTPYEGRTLKGVVKETWLRGKRIYSTDDGFDEKIGPLGKLLLKPRTKPGSMAT